MDNMAGAIVQLLMSCPPDPITTRKELLVAVRHMLALETSRKPFLKKIDVLLNEDILIGHGRATYEPVRSANRSDYGVTMLVCAGLSRTARWLTSCITSAMSSRYTHAWVLSTTIALVSVQSAQLSRVVYIFSRNLHDPTLPLTLQVTQCALPSSHFFV